MPPATTGLGDCVPTVAEASVNLYCAVWPEVAPSPSSRTSRRRRCPAIPKLVSVNEPVESAVSLKYVSSESVSWIWIVTARPAPILFP